MQICAFRAIQNIAVFFRDCSGCMFRHHIAGLPSACLQDPDTSGCARAWIYFAQSPAVFKGKRCEEQYVFAYITNVFFTMCRYDTLYITAAHCSYLTPTLHTASHSDTKKTRWG